MKRGPLQVQIFNGYDNEVQIQFNNFMTKYGSKIKFEEPQTFVIKESITKIVLYYYELKEE